MTELEKCQSGLLHDTAFEGREELIRKPFGKVGEAPYVEPNIFCGFGWNIEVGDHFFATTTAFLWIQGRSFSVIMSLLVPMRLLRCCASPGCTTAGCRAESAYPICVGSYVWFGGVKVMPGVTIGSDVVIGGGSVVTRDIPDYVLTTGNPCRVVRPITLDDKKRY